MKDPLMSVMIMGIPEPTSSVGGQWPIRQMSTGAKTTNSQWTDQDLDDFVRQLSNPQHHVSKLGTAGTSTSKSFLDQKPSRPKRAPLARSETDSGVRFGSEHLSLSPTEPNIGIGSRAARPSSENGSSSSSLGGGLLSGLSGLRLIRSKKLARSSHANAKKCATQKSLSHDFYAPSREEPALGTETVESPNGEEILGTVPGSRCRVSSTESAKNSATQSSPEGSDGERSDERKLSDPRDDQDAHTRSTSTSGVASPNPKEGKKRRFRRMLSRPLSRSQSTGCAKDVPAHALFLGERRKNSDSNSKESTSSSRTERSSEGDIRHVPVFDNDDDDDDNQDEDSSAFTMTTSRSSNSISKRRTGGAAAGALRKMESVDGTMLMGSSTDDFGLTGHDSKPKARNYNIAKKISRHMQFLRRRHTDTTIGLMDKEETRRLSDLDPAQVQEWSKSFESLLFDKNGLELFRGFLVSEHSDENIEFWIACEKYKVVKSHKQLAPLAHKIFNDYVAVQSRREVNLDSTTRTSTFEGVTSQPSRQTFDDAQKRVQALMEKDSYRRFLESELYIDLAAGNIQTKPSS